MRQRFPRGMGWALFALLSIATPGRAAPPAPPAPPAPAPGKILVVPVVGRTVPAAVVRSVDAHLQEALDAILPGRQAKRKRTPPCSTARCFADQGTAAGAQDVVIGEVLRIGGKLGVTLHLVHVANAELAKHTAEAVVPPNEAALRQALQAALRDLLTAPATPPPAQPERPLEVQAAPTVQHTDMMQLTLTTPVPGDLYEASLELANGEARCEHAISPGSPCVLRFDPSYAHLLVLRQRDEAFFSRVNRALASAENAERYPFISRKLPSTKGNFRYILQQDTTALTWMNVGGVVSIAAGATALLSGVADIVLCPRTEPGAQLGCQIGVPTAIGTAALTAVGVATFFAAREFLDGALFGEEPEGQAP